MLDLGKLGLNKNLPLYLHHLMLETTLTLPRSVRQGVEKHKEKMGRRRKNRTSCKKCIIHHASLPITPTHFGSTYPQPLSPLLCPHHQSRLILRSFNFPVYMIYSSAAKLKISNMCTSILLPYFPMQTILSTLDFINMLHSCYSHIMGFCELV